MFSYEGFQNGMDAFLFARPAVPVLPAFHPLECPGGGAAHGALGPCIGCGFDGLPDAVDEEPDEDKSDECSHGPPQYNDFRDMSHTDMPVHIENGACTGVCHQSQRPSAFTASRGGRLPATWKRSGLQRQMELAATLSGLRLTVTPPLKGKSIINTTATDTAERNAQAYMR